jgi:hypothetical protein
MSTGVDSIETPLELPTAVACRRPTARPPAFSAPPSQLEEWTCPVSDAQRSILEAVCAVLDALLRDLARTNRVDM